MGNGRQEGESGGIEVEGGTGGEGKWEEGWRGCGGAVAGLEPQGRECLEGRMWGLGSGRGRPARLIGHQGGWLVAWL